MEIKKSPKANLENKKFLFMEIGLIASVGTNQVLYLPHVNQVFSNTLLLELLGNKHG